MLVSCFWGFTVTFRYCALFPRQPKALRTTSPSELSAHRPSHHPTQALQQTNFNLPSALPPASEQNTVTSTGSLPDSPVGSHTHLIKQSEGGTHSTTLHPPPIHNYTSERDCEVFVWNHRFPSQLACLSHVCHRSRSLKEQRKKELSWEPGEFWQNLCGNHMAATWQYMKHFEGGKTLLFPKNVPCLSQAYWVSCQKTGITLSGKLV